MKLNKAVDALSALAQESRLSVFLLLIPYEEGMSAGNIAERLNIPSATLSFHLSQLSHAGLIDSRREGRMIFYKVNSKKLKKLTAFLMKGIKKVKSKNLIQETYMSLIAKE